MVAQYSDLTSKSHFLPFLSVLKLIIWVSSLCFLCAVIFLLLNPSQKYNVRLRLPAGKVTLPRVLLLSRKKDCLDAAFSS